METTPDSLMAYCSHNSDYGRFTTAPDRMHADLTRQLDVLKICDDMRGKVMDRLGAQPDYAAGVSIRLNAPECGEVVLYISHLEPIVLKRMKGIEEGKWHGDS